MSAFRAHLSSLNWRLTLPSWLCVSVTQTSAVLGLYCHSLICIRALERWFGKELEAGMFCFCTRTQIPIALMLHGMLRKNLKCSIHAYSCEWAYPCWFTLTNSPVGQNMQLSTGRSSEFYWSGLKTRISRRGCAYMRDSFSISTFVKDYVSSPKFLNSHSL